MSFFDMLLLFSIMFWTLIYIVTKYRTLRWIILYSENRTYLIHPNIHVMSVFFFACIFLMIINVTFLYNFLLCIYLLYNIELTPKKCMNKWNLTQILQVSVPILSQVIWQMCHECTFLLCALTRSKIVYWFLVPYPLQVQLPTNKQIVDKVYNDLICINVQIYT